MRGPHLFNVNFTEKLVIHSRQRLLINFGALVHFDRNSLAGLVYSTVYSTNPTVENSSSVGVKVWPSEKRAQPKNHPNTGQCLSTESKA